MNTNNIFLSLFLLLSFSFLLSCASDTSTNTTATEDNTAAAASTVAVETSTPTIKVDSAKIKKIVEERKAELAAEKAEAAEKVAAEKEKLATIEAEKIAKEKRAEKRAAKKKLAELQRKKAEEDRQAAAAAATSTIAVTELPVSKPVIKPAPPKPKPQPQAQKSAKIKFDTKTHNFGTIKEGDVIKYEFYYTNVGTEDLVIKDASATCGCTAPGFSFFPLAPGLSSAISVTFNSANKAGAQRPEVTIITNGYPSKHVLTMEGVVEK